MHSMDTLMFTFSGEAGQIRPSASQCHDNNENRLLGFSCAPQLQLFQTQTNLHSLVDDECADSAEKSATKPVRATKNLFGNASLFATGDGAKL